MINQLWRPPNEHKQAKQAKKTTKDDICKQCPNKKTCKGLCPPLAWINGRAETQEIIPASPIIKGYNQQDYNDVLYELIASQQASDADKIDTIRTIKDYRVRAIAACILAYIPQQQIASIIHISQGRISKLYRSVQKRNNQNTGIIKQKQSHD